MNNLNNFKSIKAYLSFNSSIANLNCKKNKQKSSIKILSYINELVNNSEANNSNMQIRNIKLEKIKNTFLYVLDTLQKSLNQGNLPNFTKFADIQAKKDLDEQLYLNFIGKSCIQNGVFI